MLYLKRVYIENVKCFPTIELELDLSGNTVPWTVILGDNATGKTGLLRAIALGLCDESSAAGLMKESDEGYIRRGVENNAKIVLELQRGQKGRTRYTIETTIEKVKTRHGSFERLRQRTQTKNFPRQEIFACAYGAGRGTAGTGDISGYSLINSVYNLFNYSEGLQNPELTIRRLSDSNAQQQVRELLAKITHVQRVKMTRSGISVDGDWGRGMPLRDLADGYKSTMLWLTDFLGWAIAFEQRFQSPSEIQGIVLIDEIEQHLHPQWQETVVNDLRAWFPKVRFVATTHSPLVASSIGGGQHGTSDDRLYYAERTKDKGIKYEKLPHLRGRRVDQILASRAFKYVITDSETEVDENLRKASYLMDKGENRSPQEEREYQRLKTLIARSLILKAESPIERQVQAEFLDFMQQKTAELESELFGSSNDQHQPR